MSALLDQFIEEAGDLLEATGAALLVLERNPADARAINDLFRSVHTFKGTSALFDFPALTKLVHTGEDLLDAVREGAVPVSSELVDLQLEMLDLLRTWIDTVRATGELPLDAAGSSRDLIARLAAAKAVGTAVELLAAVDANAPPGLDCDWLDGVPEAQRMAAFRNAVEEELSVLAIEYEPDKDCYFRGEDPLQTIATLPELMSLTVQTVGPDPALADFDPYACRLRFRALSTAPRTELEHLFRYVADQVRMTEIAPERLAVASGIHEVDADSADFCQECMPWIEQNRVAEVREQALELLASIDADRRAASALRWLVTGIDSAPKRVDLLLALMRGVANLTHAADSAPGSAVPASALVDRIVEEQRGILALPVDDDIVLGGRIACVGRTLANVAAAHGATAAVRTLEAATALALDRADPQPLIVAAEACFTTGAGAASLVTTADPTDVPAAVAAAQPSGGEGRSQVRMLKVDQAKVDRLMALIGELVVAKNALPFLARRAEQVHGSREMSREIGQRYSVIDRLAGEMQEAIMEVRLLPVSEVFARFPRLIRDISRKLDKQIELVLEGEETQADKNIIELLGDPLIHIVRNAADHGIESPQNRIAQGKPAHGTIRLRAMQEGDLVVIEISDDGRGVDTARVVAKALERGLIDPEQAERMSPAEAANLIFHPGLSTADEVSDLSGRGVGMDVVQTSIRDAGGSVSVTSVPGAGTKVRLALPLSMAVVRVMTIETASALYGIPIDMIAETVRIDATAIRQIKQAETFLLRDTIVPLVRLRRMLRLPSRPEEREAVLVLRTPSGLVGMIVDRFDEHMDIILKPLEGILIGLRGFAGTALLGDGRVLMVLDIKELL
jgi:two-component system chemotaxis sensor kinase CheA